MTSNRMKPGIAEVIAAKLTLYPILMSKSEDELAELYAAFIAHLRDLDPEAVSVAFDLLGGQYPPSAPEVREKAASIISGHIALRDPEMVWGDVADAARRHGQYLGYTNQADAGWTARYGPPDLFDTMTTEAIGSVGWNVICEAESEASKASNRARFIAALQAIRVRAREYVKLAPEARALLDRVRVEVLSGPGTIKQLMSGSTHKADGK